MSSARYAPLPNPRSTIADADREMREAFELDHDDDDEGDHSESTPLSQSYIPSPALRRPPLSVSTPTYDFERDYDYDHPPPGSPPDPAAARPNNYGNSNGNLPSTPVRPNHNHPSFFRRVVGAVLPQHYQRLPSEVVSSHAIGGGMNNDGVFANVMAKPSRAVEVQDANGDIYMVPEEVQGQAPPSYNEAQADAVPQYWENTVHATSLDPNADMIVDDLPTGSWYLFVANIFISYFFQFIGFLFTYLLHTTHAAKYGSRAGLGMTLIQYGFYSRRQFADEIGEIVPATSWNETTEGGPMMTIGGPSEGRRAMDPTNGTSVEVNWDGYDLTSRDWVAFLLMTLGWFLLLSSLAGFYRVKRWEKSIRTTASPSSTVEVQHDANARHNLGNAFPDLFGFSADDENHERQLVDGRPMTESEARLARDLRDAGLI
ncbi:hypothetical protein PHLCEN_2v7203 [Hermanssonia centrifuga]|uniref:Metal homeostatis protein bsd2 n=1 Tax=Hermanssonia centrifuga TaxID=98765 RepID=A0A2R6NXB9_9APHY|nr:hypothetical protein PHLCEN_2v7203 [Hermanssonia centrifuga]